LGSQDQASFQVAVNPTSGAAFYRLPPALFSHRFRRLLSATSRNWNDRFCFDFYSSARPRPRLIHTPRLLHHCCYRRTGWPGSALPTELHPSYLSLPLRHASFPSPDHRSAPPAAGFPCYCTAPQRLLESSSDPPRPRAVNAPAVSGSTRTPIDLPHTCCSRTSHSNCRRNKEKIIHNKTAN
jgi:hypothetical protein